MDMENLNQVWVADANAPVISPAPDLTNAQSVPNWIQPSPSGPDTATFKVTAAERSPDGQWITLAWSSVPGRTYQAQGLQTLTGA